MEENRGKMMSARRCIKEFTEKWDKIPGMQSPLVFIDNEIVNQTVINDINMYGKSNNIKLLVKYHDSEIKITFNNRFPYSYSKTEILIDGKHIKSETIENDIGKYWTPVFGNLTIYIQSLYHDYKDINSPNTINKNYLFLELNLL